MDNTEMNDKKTEWNESMRVYISCVQVLHTPIIGSIKNFFLTAKLQVQPIITFLL
jgi:hypothetical protein